MNGARKAKKALVSWVYGYGNKDVVRVLAIRLMTRFEWLFLYFVRPVSTL